MIYTSASRRRRDIQNDFVYHYNVRLSALSRYSRRPHVAALLSGLIGSDPPWWESSPVSEGLSRGVKLYEQ